MQANMKHGSLNEKSNSRLLIWSVKRPRNTRTYMKIPKLKCMNSMSRPATVIPEFSNYHMLKCQNHPNNSNDQSNQSASPINQANPKLVKKSVVFAQHYVRAKQHAVARAPGCNLNYKCQQWDGIGALISPRREKVCSQSSSFTQWVPSLRGAVHALYSGPSSLALVLVPQSQLHPHPHVPHKGAYRNISSTPRSSKVSHCVMPLRAARGLAAAAARKLAREPLPLSLSPLDVRLFVSWFFSSPLGQVLPCYRACAGPRWCWDRCSSLISVTENPGAWWHVCVSSGWRALFPQWLSVNFFFGTRSRWFEMLSDLILNDSIWERSLMLTLLRIKRNDLI